MAVKNASLRPFKVSRSAKLQRAAGSVHLGRVPSARGLLHGLDCGEPIVVPPEPYIGISRDPGWGPHLEAFLNRNEASWRALELTPRVIAGRNGIRLELQPGLRAGAVPLCSAMTGQVAGGIVIRPRFGWVGVGRVLSSTGWGSGPEFLPLPLVPGSGREVPPWVLAGPVLQRLSDLLVRLKPGYRERIEKRSQPRGQIQWHRYLTEQIPRGRWHNLPCKFSELDEDIKLKQAIRWTLERVRSDLGSSGCNDAVALSLVHLIAHLMARVSDVTARRPGRAELDTTQLVQTLASPVVKEGLRAMGWVVDERGLGGGQTSDGLAWTIPLEKLWERYVASLLQSEAALSGGRLQKGEKGETTVPLLWHAGGRRALGHLVPDFIIQRPGEVEIVDAKYKSHYADLSVARWFALSEETQSSMRADIHQVLAYAAVVGSAPLVRSTLIYPITPELFSELKSLGRIEIRATIPIGRNQLELCLRAVPFGK